jgi:acyl carrier protein
MDKHYVANGIGRINSSGTCSADRLVIVYITIIRIQIMIFEKVADIIVNTAHCKLEDVQSDSKLEALGVDSLKAITVIFELEEAFDVEIPNEVIPSIVTVKDIVNRLEAAHS